MILSPLFTPEVGEKSSEDLPAKVGSDLHDDVDGEVHNDIIEAIHKEILQKSQHYDFMNLGEGFTLEGIVHIDRRESHYRVKTEMLGSVGPVYAVKICTITHPPSPNIVAPSTHDRFPFFDKRLIACNLDTENISDSPLDFSSKLPSKQYPDSTRDQEIGQTVGSSLTKADTMLNKIEKVLRGPVGYGSSGTSGFGSGARKKKSGDIVSLFFCPTCVYCCAKKGELKKHHTSVHLDGKPYGCPFCPYRSTHKSTLRSHIMSRHTGERPFDCPYCDYKASQKGLVDKHVMTKHTMEKPFKCPHCDFSSSHSSTVKTHIMFKHTGEKPFNCPHCQYKAVQRGHIVRHIRAVHSGEKPFQCPHCDYRACRNTNIKKHVVAVHNKEKPHQCPHCHFKSSHKGNLNSHMISKHTQMKPFVCHLCDYKSSCRTGLNRHLLKHTGVKKVKLQCHYCPYASDRKDHLRTHVSYVHFKGNKTLIQHLQFNHVVGKSQTGQNTEVVSDKPTGIDVTLTTIDRLDPPKPDDPD